MKSARYPDLFLCLIFAAFVGTVPIAAADEVPPQHIDDSLAGWPLAALTLLDQHGAPFTNERLQGKWTFVLIGDTQCGTPCTTALEALAGLSARIAGTAKIPQVLFISLAPERDTPPVLAAHLRPYDPHFIGTSGAPATLAPLLEDLHPELASAHATGVRPDTPGYRGSLFLVGPDGALRGEFHPPFDVPRFTATYLKLRLRG